MLNTQRTPGPFAYNEKGNITYNGEPYPYSTHGMSEEGLRRAEQFSEWLNTQVEQDAAHAAASDLLVACKSLREFVDSLVAVADSSGYVEININLARVKEKLKASRDAIAKAKSHES